MQVIKNFTRDTLQALSLNENQCVEINIIKIINPTEFKDSVIYEFQAKYQIHVFTQKFSS